MRGGADLGLDPALVVVVVKLLGDFRPGMQEATVSMIARGSANCWRPAPSMGKDLSSLTCIECLRCLLLGIARATARAPGLVG